MTDSSTLFTDLYQLIMLQAYFLNSDNQPAVFECFIRSQEKTRNFYIAMGQADVLEYLDKLHFTKQDLEYLRQTNLFDADFLEYLKTLRFTGDVYAMDEGEVCFAKEPILQIHAPIIEAQLIESRLLNIMHYQTLIASKAARSVLQAKGKKLYDFGLRRAHGHEAAMMAAKASCAVGFAGSATVEAGRKYNLPLIGTMAHSFISSYPDEYSAFKAFAKAHPNNIILLIDTYDTLAGTDNVIRLANETKYIIKGVRIDSGDLALLSQQVRKKLNQAGLENIEIYVSGDLDEYKLHDLRDMPINGFGVGTRLSTSNDCPSLDMVYKLQHYQDRDIMKYSPGKVSIPGVKQVWRKFNSAGKIHADTLALKSEQIKGTALLNQVMAHGKILSAASSNNIVTIQKNVTQSLSTLPLELLSLKPATIEVGLSPKLQLVLDAGKKTYF